MADAFYQSTPWRKLRREVLDANPLCEDCSKVPPEVVHHIVPRSHGGAELDKRNLAALCRACHKHRHGPLIWLMRRSL